MPVKAKGTLEANLAKVDFGIRNGLNAAGQLVISAVNQVFEQNKPRGIATGELRQSITKTPVVVKGGHYEIRIGPSAKHGIYVHHGRRPGGKFPPIEAILRWIDVKGIAVRVPPKRNTKTGRYRKAKRSEIESAKRSLAYLIARKIATKGIEPYPYLTVGYNVVKDRIPGIIAEEIKKSMGA
jgi:hypothetical protein